MCIYLKVAVTKVTVLQGLYCIVCIWEHFQRDRTNLSVAERFPLRACVLACLRVCVHASIVVTAIYCYPELTYILTLYPSALGFDESNTYGTADGVSSTNTPSLSPSCTRVHLLSNASM